MKTLLTKITQYIKENQDINIPNKNF